MNKYLLISAAALIGSATSFAMPANAFSTTIGFSGYCDGMSLNTNDRIVYAGNHLFTGCGGTSISYTAIAGKNKRFNSDYHGGKKFIYVENYATYTIAYGYEIQLPIATGNHGTSFCTSNATSAWECLSGTYYTGYSPAKGKLVSKPPSSNGLRAKIRAG